MLCLIWQRIVQLEFHGNNDDLWCWTQLSLDRRGFVHWICQEIQNSEKDIGWKGLQNELAVLVHRHTHIIDRILTTVQIFTWHWFQTFLGVCWVFSILKTDHVILEIVKSLSICSQWRQECYIVKLCGWNLQYLGPLTSVHHSLHIWAAGRPCFV